MDTTCCEITTRFTKIGCSIYLGTMDGANIALLRRKTDVACKVIYKRESGMRPE
jgi:hypothetical protein